MPLMLDGLRDCKRTDLIDNIDVSVKEIIASS